MISLKEISGLPLEVGPDHKLKFHRPLPETAPNIRTFKDVQPVLLDPAADPGREEMYYMYRDVHIPDDEPVIRGMGLSYDVTVIPPAMVGREFNKTVGHYHALKPGTGIAYPEIYEVLHGKALFLLQKMDPEFKQVIAVIAMEAKAGDKVIYPPNYGHIIANIGSEVLVTSNWVGDNFERMYKPVSDQAGLAYYVVSDGGNGYQFEPNKHYPGSPAVRVIDGKFMDGFAIMKPGPMYSLGVANPKSLEFLSNPERYAVELSSITS